MGSRIVTGGFVSEYEYEQDRGRMSRIWFPVTGHFFMEEDKPETLALYDDYTRMIHSLNTVTMMWERSNPLEGKKRFPRPFLYDRTGAEDHSLGILKTAGDKVMIVYLGGSVYQPAVIGSIEHLGIVSQKTFLRIQGENLERTVERSETDDATIEYENDGKGNVTLTMITKNGDTALIDIGINGQYRIQDVDGTKDKGETGYIRQSIEMGTGGLMQVNQYDSSGELLQQVSIDKANGIRLQGQLRKVSEYAVYGDTLETILNDLMAQLDSLVQSISTITVAGVMSGPSVSGPPVNVADFTAIGVELATIKAQIETILVK